MTKIRTLRIGTRASKLAMAQTHLTVAAIKRLHPEIALEIVTADTTGDKTQAANTPLQKIGGKGLFADALNQMMDEGRVDMIVHSMKDLPSVRPDKYRIAAMLERGDPRDCLLTNMPNAAGIDDLPQGAIVGTSAPRRAAVLLRKRPDLKVVVYRGNVDTRLQKLRDGFEGVAATFLARVGLVRLGLTDIPQTILSADEFLPPAGQAAIGIEIMRANEELYEVLKDIGCAKTFRCVTAERACLAVVDGDCKTSIAAYATEENGTIRLRSEIYTPDGKDMQKVEVSGPAPEAEALGTQAGEKLLAAIGASDFARYHMRVPADV